jgi:phosphatidylglycerol:prolipoprotein diacylglycerol transferase
MLPLLRIGPLTLRTPGLALLAGLWLGLEIASREGVRRGIHGDRIYNLGFYTVVAGILGARLGFVLLNLGLYTRLTPWVQALGAVFALTPGTEIAWIGVLAAVGVAAFFIRRWQLSPLAVADAFAPGAAIFAAGIGLANLLSGDYYGVETTAPWGIYLWAARRQPTQLLFILSAVRILYLLLRLGRDPSRRPPGLLAQVLVTLLSLAILLIEPLRGDSPVVGDGIRVWQVIALVGLAGGLATFASRAPVVAPEPVPPSTKESV